MTSEGVTVSQLLTGLGQSLQWLAVEVDHSPELFPVGTEEFGDLETFMRKVEHWTDCFLERKAPPAAFRHILVSLLHGMVR